MLLVVVWNMVNIFFKTVQLELIGTCLQISELASEYDSIPHPHPWQAGYELWDPELVA
jgi:hypothetical protein